MNTQPSVVVNKKSGFFAALAKGVFGLLTVSVICVTVLAVYGVRVADRKVDNLVGNATDLVAEVLEILPEWQRAAPPAIADALHDRRAVDYRNDLKLEQRLIQTENGYVVLVVDVHNVGDEVVTLLPLRMLLFDGSGVPVEEQTTYAATPLMIDNDWNGPIPPGDTPRTVSVTFSPVDDLSDFTASVEMVDLRVAVPVERLAQAPRLPAPDAASDADEHEHSHAHHDDE